MAARLLADALVVVHLAFVLFALLGGLLAFRHPAWIVVHLPAAGWAAWVEATASVCPLTPLENLMRVRAGQQGYAGSFVEHYLLPVLYPSGITADVQLALAAGVVAINAGIYLAWLRRRRRQR